MIATHTHTHTHRCTHRQLPPVPMVTWRQGGRDLTIELFAQQQHTHTVCVTYLTYGSHTHLYLVCLTHTLTQRKHDVIDLFAAGSVSAQ